jgi:hypothetical protein
MIYGEALKNADTEVKIRSAKEAIKKFNDDPYVTDYTKAYMNVVTDTLLSAIEDLESDIAYLNEKVGDNGSF